MTSNRNLFAKDFKVVFLDGAGQGKRYDVQMQNYFSGHVVGEDPQRGGNVGEVYLALFFVAVVTVSPPSSKGRSILVCRHT